MQFIVMSLFDKDILIIFKIKEGVYSPSDCDYIEMHWNSVNYVGFIL